MKSDFLYPMLEPAQKWQQSTKNYNSATNQITMKHQFCHLACFPIHLVALLCSDHPIKKKYLSLRITCQAYICHQRQTVREILDTIGPTNFCHAYHMN